MFYFVQAPLIQQLLQVFHFTGELSGAVDAHLMSTTFDKVFNHVRKLVIELHFRSKMLQRWNHSTPAELLLKRRVYCKYVNSVTINLCIHFILSTQLCQAYDLSESMVFYCMLDHFYGADFGVI